MRLYTSRQLFAGILAAAVMSALLLGGAFLLGTRSGGIALEPGQPHASVTAPPQPAVGSPSATLPAIRTTVTDPGAATVAADQDPGPSAGERENIDVYERFNESVVNITTEVVNVNWFLEPVPQSGGSGSGSVIDARGYVLTNNHVVKDAFKLYVNLADGSRYEAKVVGTDPETDLAIIKFAPPAGLRLKPVPFGSSKDLKVGQKVLAIGNPFGLERTLTEGIVSGLGRPIQTDSTTIMQNMIQTDASINPGNSGGPLFNTRGEMIGVNTMIYSPSGGSVGIGFAIPMDTAMRIVPSLMKDGAVRRGWIEIEALQLFPDLVEYLSSNGFGAPVEKGLLLSTVSREGNAEKAGLRGGSKAVRYGRTVFNVGGDIIVNVDGRDIASIADLYSALEDNRPGDRVWVDFWRAGKKQRVQVTLTERSRER